MEALAAELTRLLDEAIRDEQSNEEILTILQRIKDEIVWGHAFSQSESGTALYLAVGICSAARGHGEDKRISALHKVIAEAHYTQSRDDDIRQTEALWWNIDPVPDDDERLTLEFRDVTADHKTWTVNEVWPPETVEGSQGEAFGRVAQRFRVQANRKHRHPYYPSLQFDAILKSGRVSFSALVERTVADVVSDLSEERIVPFVRNDEDNHAVYSSSPARHFDAWERTLPEWCKTPDHWVEPTPPPGFVEGDIDQLPLKEQYYIKVPTLLMGGTGRLIIPSAKQPNVISRSLFVPVRKLQNELITFYNLERDADLVPYSAHLVPGQITVDAARALLGRVVQSSTEPLPDWDAEPGVKRRKINKYATQTLGYAWGLQTEEGKAAWLFCMDFGSRGVFEYVLDLTGQNRTYGDWRSPIVTRTLCCAWLRVAVLPADVRVMKAGSNPGGGETSVDRRTEPPSTDGVLPYNEWRDRTDRWKRALNRKRNAPVVEVGPDGTFVGGDLELSKGDVDEFEAEVTGAKPGIWLMAIEPSPREELGEDEEIDEEAKTIRIRAPATDPEAAWEVVGSFSVDSGIICLFSKHALDAILATGTDRQAMLEAFIDDDEGDRVFVPSGVVVSGNDGGYDIKGRRDAEGSIVELRLRL
ncbi:hypothetical protein BN946_scf184414.g7 [Trametes cinnabarina]|uniref:Uncharacterized protein n=1 Tax=Pycnoporus cinnabarinus TaxID=5643 RepID=A0A060SPQ4_PYCCI|nr:hypothetical protein BN946_scf184414.g7 [Trametes cinnabarina]